MCGLGACHLHRVGRRELCDHHSYSYMVFTCVLTAVRGLCRSCKCQAVNITSQLCRVIMTVCVCLSLSSQGCLSLKVTWGWGPSWARPCSTSSASSACVASSPARYRTLRRSTTNSQKCRRSNILTRTHKVVRARLRVFTTASGEHTNTPCGVGAKHVGRIRKIWICGI